MTDRIEYWHQDVGSEQTLLLGERTRGAGETDIDAQYIADTGETYRVTEVEQVANDDGSTTYRALCQGG